MSKEKNPKVWFDFERRWFHALMLAIFPGSDRFSKIEESQMGNILLVWQKEAPSSATWSLRLLLWYLHCVAPLTSGYFSGFSRLSQTKQSAVLELCQNSKYAIVANFIELLKMVVAMAYCSSRDNRMKLRDL